MWEKLQEIIGSIEVRELESRTLLEVFLNASNHRDADQIMRAKGFNSSTTFCQEYRALHLLCQSAIHYASDLHLALDTALRNAQQALEGFRYQGNQFNEALAHRVISIIYEKRGELSKAIAELKQAINIFKSFSDLYEQENDLQAKRRCDVQIQECNKALKRIESGLPPKSSSHSHAKWPSLRLIQHVYDFGHASLVGKFVLEDKPITAVEINQVLIDGKPYELLAVQEDVHAITIPPGHQLFWLKIAGQSMNQASPTPIHEGDYVLIDHNRLPSNGDIVFAQINHPPTPAERAGIIKRLKGSSLYSESDLSIPPIPLTRVTIKGIVIAIAKPVV